MKSILLHVADDAHFESRLQGALDLARFTGGHIECLQTRRIPAYMGADAAGFAGSASMLVQLMEDEARVTQAERDALSKRLFNENVPYSFAEAIGEASYTLVDRSLLADIIVMTLAGSDQRELVQSLAAVVTKADAPVLAIPPSNPHIDYSKPAMIAWKPTTEAAHAVKRSRPLLQKIGRADIVVVDTDSDEEFPAMEIASYLSRHGVKAEIHRRQSNQRTTSDTLLATAAELESSLIVMGGYGRSRAMEFLLGGVTHRLLSNSGMPLLLAH